MTPAAAPPPDFETQARELIAKIEHGDEKHRQWLRDVCTPLIVTAIQAAWTVAQAASAERIAELEEHCAEVNRTCHQYQLIAEQKIREKQTAESALAESERRREAAEKMLAEADAVIASNCGGYAFPHIRGTALAPCWDWKDQAVARHAARAKEG